MLLLHQSPIISSICWRLLTVVSVIVTAAATEPESEPPTIGQPCPFGGDDPGSSGSGSSGSSLERIANDINVYDHRLGLVLHQRQLRFWNKETAVDGGGSGGDDDCPALQDEQQQQQQQMILMGGSLDTGDEKAEEEFYSEYIRWAMRNYHEHCANERHPKHCSIYEHCRYWANAAQMFGHKFQDEEEEEEEHRGQPEEQREQEQQQEEQRQPGLEHQESEEFDHRMVSQWIRALSAQIKQLKISHRGQTLLCQESLEQWMMVNVVDPRELKEIWLKCHQQLDSGSIPDLFEMILGKLGGDIFKELWLHWNKDLGIHPADLVLDKILVLWNQARPFYRLLFDYIRHRLRSSLSAKDSAYRNSSTIPVHWLRSLIGTRLNTILDLVRPYNQDPVSDGSDRSVDVDVDPASVNPKQDAEDFYVKIGGFRPLPPEFWNRSRFIWTKTDSCHPLAMDLILGQDVRINMCLTNDSEYDSRRMFHELGHAYYYLASRQRRNLYRLDHNSAAHESIGEVMRLLRNGCRLQQRATKQRAALNSSSLLDHYQQRINALMDEALSSFQMLPYGIALELWRFGTFTMTPPPPSNGSTIEQLNRNFWSIREQFQGFRSPLDLNPDQREIGTNRLLDPLLKFHVANFVPYLRYVFGTILMHQFHEKICKKPGGEDRGYLVECCPQDPSDLDLFRKFLEIDLNRKDNNPDHLQIIRQLFNGSDDLYYQMDSLLHYYQPLIEWLQQWKTTQRKQQRKQREKQQQFSKFDQI